MNFLTTLGLTDIIIPITCLISYRGAVVLASSPIQGLDERSVYNESADDSDDEELQAELELFVKKLRKKVGLVLEGDGGEELWLPEDFEFKYVEVNYIFFLRLLTC